jgi:uncharacterized membrane protein YhhN
MKKVTLILFIIVSLCELISKFTAVEWLHTVCKPLIMVLLGLYYFLSTDREDRSPVVLAAIIFSMTGDVLLMLPDKFVPGLIAFLLSHIFYILAYRQHRDEETENALSNILRIRLAFPIILAGSGLVVILYPSLGELKIPVIIYAAVLSMMVLQALFRFGRTNTASFWMIFTGAVFFMISDSVLAIDKFLKPISNADFLIMLTYITAQYLIVRGLVKHYQPKGNVFGTIHSEPLV